MLLGPSISPVCDTHRGGSMRGLAVITRLGTCYARSLSLTLQEIIAYRGWACSWHQGTSEYHPTLLGNEGQCPLGKITVSKDRDCWWEEPLISRVYVLQDGSPSMGRVSYMEGLSFLLSLKSEVGCNSALSSRYVSVVLAFNTDKGSSSGPEPSLGRTHPRG